MIRDLCHTFTDLSDNDIDILQNISSILPVISELVKADVFIDCLTMDSDVAVVVAEAEPVSVLSLYKHNVTGEFALSENEPAVLRTLKIGMTTRDLKAVTQENTTVKQDVVPIRNPLDKTIGALIMEKDITDNINKNKRIEMLTETTEQLTETILSLTNNENMITNYLNDAVVLFDGHGMVRYRNPVAEELFKRIGYKDDIMGMGFDNLTLNNSPFKDIISKKQIYTVDTIVGRLTLQNKYIVPDIKSDLIKMIMIIKDITEVKEKEKELILKSVAIKEIHHRVKNNLQTIASLLRLQSRRVDNDLTKVALDESINRILSISATHEILAQSGVDDVDIKTVLSKIKNNTESYFSLPNKNIDVEINGDSVIIDSDKATSIALVVNELLQNSFEHAFDGMDKGTIEISIQKGKFYSSISIIDNGTGFDVNSITDSSLGLNIVKSIIKNKINGNMNIYSTQKGTKVSFDFKNN